MILGRSGAVGGTVGAVPTTATHRPLRPWVIVAIAAVALILGAGALNARLDPYRVGTTHEVVLDPGPDVDECGPHWIGRLENGSSWIPAGRIADDGAAPIPGTITITADRRGSFESDPEVGSRMFPVVEGAVALDCTPAR